MIAQNQTRTLIRGMVGQWSCDGGDSNGDGNASDTTQDITKVFATNGAFAAIRADNKVVTWGNASNGGDSSAVASIINGTLDADSISVSASVSAGVSITHDYF